MARYPNDTVLRIKQEVSLVGFVEAQGYELKKQGTQFVLSCPFHEDKTPSCFIDPVKNVWRCFGCNEGGDNIRWVQKTLGLSFRHAVDLLQQNDPSLLAADSGSKPVKNTTIRKLPAPVEADADQQTALKQVIEFYHEECKQSGEIEAYLQSRGLYCPELIDTFKLGYANRSLGCRARVPDFFLSTHGAA